MNGNLTLSIELGNDAMCKRSHMSAALKEVAKRIRNKETEGKIKDVNGNTVGEWFIVKAKP